MAKTEEGRKFYDAQIDKFISAPSDSFQIESPPEMKEEINKIIKKETLEKESESASMQKGITRGAYKKTKQLLEEEKKSPVTYEEVLANPLIKTVAEKEKAEHTEYLKRVDEENKKREEE